MDRVYGFIAYRTAEPAAAEDLTQATFERALRAWPRYSPARAPVAVWLLAIARNLLIDDSRRRRPTPVGLAADLPPEPVPGPEERFAGSPELARALAALNERERDVLALRYGADLPGPEIAALLELTVANVQQISSRALRRLRDRLGDAAPVGSGGAGT